MAETLQGVDRPVVTQREPRGDLDLQKLRVDAAGGHDLEDLLERRGTAQPAWRQVHADADGTERDLPAARAPARLGQDEAVDGNDQVGLLGERNERTGRQESAL